MPEFTTPTTTESSDDILFGRYKIEVGMSVIQQGDGVYHTVSYPWMGEIAGLVEGVDWFRGGCTYSVTETVAAALSASGYEVSE